MIYNGQDLSSLIIINKVERAMTPLVTNVVKQKRFIKREYAEKTITVRVTIKHDVLQTIDVLNRVFSVPNQKLILKDQPTRYYEAVLTGEIIPTSSVRGAELQLQFLIPKGVSYSTAEKNGTVIGGKLTVENNGTAPVYPTYTFIAASPYKMIALAHPNGKAVQYGYENGEDIIKTGDVVRFESESNTLLINGKRKYINPASQVFGILPGTTQIEVSADGNKAIPSIKCIYRECWL